MFWSGGGKGAKTAKGKDVTSGYSQRMIIPSYVGGRTLQEQHLALGGTERNRRGTGIRQQERLV